MKILQHTILLLAAVGFLSCKDEINTTSKTEITNIEKSAEDIQRDSIITFAKQYMGTKYCYASGNPNKGFDCSGFVNLYISILILKYPAALQDLKI